MPTSPLLLLGAGASAPAGIPTAIGMTQKMVSFSENENKYEYNRALWAIIGALQMGLGQHQISSGVDIERVLNAAIMLGNRFNLEFAPFVGAWHPIIDDLEYQRIHRERENDPLLNTGLYGLRMPTMEQVIRQRMPLTVLSNPNPENEELLRKILTYMAMRPNGALFHDLTAYLRGKLVELLWIENSETLNYFDPLIDYAKSNKVTIATLNYDNSIECRSAHKGVICDTGISSWNRDGNFPALKKGIELIKLHGSVKWWWSEPREEDPFGLYFRLFLELDDSQRDQILRHNAAESKGLQLAVIFGGHNKMTAAGPFLDLLTRFRQALNETSKLIVIGYSCRDKHVNEIILHWLNRNPQSEIVFIEREGHSGENHPMMRALFSRGVGFDNRVKFEPIGAVEGIKKYLNPSVNETQEAVKPK